jgi:hypothetical protein
MCSKGGVSSFYLGRLLFLCDILPINDGLWKNNGNNEHPLLQAQQNIMCRQPFRYITQYIAPLVESRMFDCRVGPDTSLLEKEDGVPLLVGPQRRRRGGW